MAAGQVREERWLEDQRAVARRFFEPRLQDIGLSVGQIEASDLKGLHDALERVDDAIRRPEQFGVLSLKMTADIGLVVAAARQEAHVEIGILPLLLERKQIILDRLRELTNAKGVSNLRDLIVDISDPTLRTRLEVELTELESESQRLRAEKAEVRVAQEQASQVSVTELEEKRFELERLERRSAVWQSFLERESVATIIGAVLLLALVTALVVAMFTKTVVPDLLSNAFLIILGYFFGQASTRRSVTS